MITWILITIATPVLHNLLLKWIVYRWLINSIIYPWHIYRVNRTYNKLTHDERLKRWCDYQIIPHWSKQFWFGRSIDKYILLKWLDK